MMKAIWIVTVTAVRLGTADGKPYSTTVNNMFATEDEAISFRAAKRRYWYEDDGSSLKDHVLHLDSNMERLSIDVDELADFERKFEVTMERNVTLHKVYTVMAEDADAAQDKAETLAEDDEWFETAYEVTIYDEDGAPYDCDDVTDC